MKLNVTLDDRLVERIEAYADSHYMSRSGLISIACTTFLQSQEVAGAVVDMARCIRKIADKGTVDHETLEQLEDFQRLADMLAQSGIIK